MADDVLLDEVLEEALVEVIHDRRAEREQLAGEPLGSDLCRPSPAGQETDDPRGAEEDGEIDEILLVGDGQGPQRGDNEVVDQQEAHRRGQQGRPEAAQDRDHGDKRHVEEDEFPLWRMGLQQDSGQERWKNHRRQRHCPVFQLVAFHHTTSLAQMPAG